MSQEITLRQQFAEELDVALDRLDAAKEMLGALKEAAEAKGIEWAPFLKLAKVRRMESEKQAKALAKEEREEAERMQTMRAFGWQPDLFDLPGVDRAFVGGSRSAEPLAEPLEPEAPADDDELFERAGVATIVAGDDE